MDPHVPQADGVTIVSGHYALPAGVTVSGIVTVGSGRPFNIVAGPDLNEDGDTVQSDRPRRPRAHSIGIDHVGAGIAVATVLVRDRR